MFAQLNTKRVTALVVALMPFLAMLVGTTSSNGPARSSVNTPCPEDWAQRTLTMVGLVDCQDPYGFQHLSNNSDFVWSVTDYDSGYSKYYWGAQTWESELFRTQLNSPAPYFSPVSYPSPFFVGQSTPVNLAPGETLILPLNFQTIKVSVLKKLTALWVAQDELGDQISGYLKSTAYNAFTQNSRGRAALVKCTLLAWNSIQLAVALKTPDDMDKVVDKALGTAAKAKSCEVSINEARGLSSTSKDRLLATNLAKMHDAVEEGGGAVRGFVELFSDIGHFRLP